MRLRASQAFEVAALDVVTGIQHNLWDLRRFARARFA